MTSEHLCQDGELASRLESATHTRSLETEARLQEGREEGGIELQMENSLFLKGSHSNLQASQGFRGGQ